jgi:hypothetical protein
LLPNTTVSGAVPTIGFAQKIATGGAAVAVRDGMRLGKSVMLGIGVRVRVAVDVLVTVTVGVAVDVRVRVAVAVFVMVAVAVFVTVADDVLVSVTVGDNVGFTVADEVGLTGRSVGATVEGVGLGTIATRVRWDSGRLICRSTYTAVTNCSLTGWNCPHGHGP